MTIYQITNTVNGKIYIGKTTKTIEERFQGHIRHSRFQSQTYLHRAIRKYGTEAFTVTELESGFNSEDDLNEAEIRYIAELNPQYNMTEGGDGTSGFVMSEETKRKMSAAHKGRKLSDEFRKKMSEVRKGWNLSEEIKEKIRATMKGRKLSEEHKRKIGAANKGRKHSDEFRKKLSEVRKGKKHSEETKRKMSESMKGKNRGPLSEEQKRKLREPVTCPYCQKTGGKSAMRRWHFERCKQKRTEAASN